MSIERVRAETQTYVPAEALGISQEQEQEAELIGRLKAKGEWEHFTPEFVGTQVQSLSVPLVRHEIATAQQIYKEARIGQPEGRVKIDSALPITVFFLGDVHYGSIYTDHDTFHKQVAEIMATGGAYAIFMSNMIDNAIPAKFPSNLLVNAIPPDKQVVVMRKVAQELNERGKLLGAITSPCHEGWTWANTGQDINALMYGFEDRRFPVLENGSSLFLTLGQTEYRLSLYHQAGPFESNFNETHALRQVARLQENMAPDIVAGAHRHVGATAQSWEGKDDTLKIVTYVRTGTYKGTGEIHDQWIQGRRGVSGEPGGQSVTLWPEIKRVEDHIDFDTGMLSHEAHFLLALSKRNCKV